MDDKDNSILLEAHRIVYGRGEQDYGTPFDDFTRTAKLWSVILNKEISARQVGLCMALLKISRDCNAPKRDNMVDLAGYAETVHRVDTKQNQLENEDG